MNSEVSLKSPSFIFFSPTTNNLLRLISFVSPFPSLCPSAAEQMCVNSDQWSPTTHSLQRRSSTTSSSPVRIFPTRLSRASRPIVRIFSSVPTLVTLTGDRCRWLQQTCICSKSWKIFVVPKSKMCARGFQYPLRHRRVRIVSQERTPTGRCAHTATASSLCRHFEKIKTHNDGA